MRFDVVDDVGRSMGVLLEFRRALGAVFDSQAAAGRRRRGRRRRRSAFLLCQPLLFPEFGPPVLKPDLSNRNFLLKLRLSKRQNPVNLVIIE